MKISLTLDSIAILLYCSELYYSEEEPFSNREWDYIEKKVKHSQFKTPANLLGQSFESLSVHLDLDEVIISKINRMNSCLGELMKGIAKLESLGINITTKYESNYPVLFKNKLKKDYPSILYYAGNFDLLKSSVIYLTGPIKTNSRISANTRRIIEKLGEENYTLITSSSRGVEKTAMNQYLKNGGKVVEFSCENILNSKKTHARAIKSGQMLLMTARHPFATFDLIQAIDRNQYIYCLSELAIIVYSSINSGATWLSAIQNLNNKYTKLAAVVDDEFYGNARLIEMGAIPLTMELIDSDATIQEMTENPVEEDSVPIYYDQLSIYDFLK